MQELHRTVGNGESVPGGSHLRFHVDWGPAQSSNSTGARAGPAYKPWGVSSGKVWLTGGGGQGHVWQRPQRLSVS